MNKVLLLDVLSKARGFMSLEFNRFIWTSWENSKQAIDELQQIQREIEQDDFSNVYRLKIIFGPTGPMQELSIDSGWSDEFIKLAVDFDKAVQVIVTE